MGDAVNEMQQFLEMERPDATIKTPADFTEPDDLYRVLEETILKYHPSSDLSMIRKAYETAREAHKEQRRKSGEPYIIHPICVAIILAELQLDKETIAAGLLHDIIEDTPMEFEDVAREFNPEIAKLVDGVTKLTQVNWDRGTSTSKENAKSELQAENLRKMFIAMAKDIRVILIKLADRLHNMRTMQYQSPAKQIEKSRETMDIYAPIADRLGISKVKTELDDWSLRYLYPDVYRQLSEQLCETREKRLQFIEQIKQEVTAEMEKQGIECSVSGRVKHYFSIYKKMLKQNKTLEQIYDVFAVRIIVKDKRDCYAALGMIHDMYTPIPGRFKDYIAMPKPNHYQSLHTTLMGRNGQPFEIQIRTEEMHQVAEYGIAAHWKYKEKGSGVVEQEAEEKKLSWLREILEWQQASDNNTEFVAMVKNDFDLFSDRVYCFTPKGDIKDLVAGSTPIDFAYSVHTAIGNRMAGAKVNGRVVPFDYVLKSGDLVDITTSQNVTPNMNWLNIVKSAQAKSKIQQWFKAAGKEGNITKGRELIQNYCKSKSINLLEINKPEYQKAVLDKFGFKTWDTVLATVGHGGLKEGQVVNRLLDAYKKTTKEKITDEEVLAGFDKTPAQTVQKRSKGGITVHGLHDVAVRFSRCCSPVPGDEIVGFVTRGRGVSIHRTDCANMINLNENEKNRLIEAAWDPNASSDNEYYDTEICIYAEDRRGLIADLSRVFEEQKISINRLNSHGVKNGGAMVCVSFNIKSLKELNGLMNRLRMVRGVSDIERTIGI